VANERVDLGGRGGVGERDRREPVVGGLGHRFDEHLTGRSIGGVGVQQVVGSAARYDSYRTVRVPDDVTADGAEQPGPAGADDQEAAA